MQNQTTSIEQIQTQKVKSIRDYLEEIKMPALRKKLLKLYDDIELKLKSNPASIKFHHNYPSGLYMHTKEVIENALKIFDIFKDSLNSSVKRDDVIFMAFAHDLEKLTKYKKNLSQKAGKEEPYFYYNYSKVDFNDTSEVVRLLARYDLDLSDEQLNALTFHMGGFSVDRGKMLSLAVLIHAADLISSNIQNANDKYEQVFAPQSTNDARS